MQLAKKWIGRNTKKVCRKPEARLKDGSNYIDVSIEKENQKMKGMCISSIPYDANSKDLRENDEEDEKKVQALRR